MLHTNTDHSELKILNSLVSNDMNAGREWSGDGREI